MAKTNSAKIGVAWIKESKTKSGKKYLNVKVEAPVTAGTYFHLWKNDFKVKGTNQPDYNVMLYPSHA